ncbi:MAG: hypothetical protein RI897_754 [Verrucomicrobiota bacterium]
MVSVSLRGVTMEDWPGRRRSRSGWTSVSERARPGGQPSMTTPTPPPWDSPQVVIRKSSPKVLPMAGGDCGKTGLASNIRGFGRGVKCMVVSGV